MDNIAGKRDYPEYERLYRGNTPRPFVCHVEDESLMLDFDKFHGKYKSIFYPKLGKVTDKDDWELIFDGNREEQIKQMKDGNNTCYTTKEDQTFGMKRMIQQQMMSTIIQEE